MKPHFSVVTHIDICVANIVNDLTSPRSPEPPRTGIVLAHILGLLLLCSVRSSTCNATLVLTACSGNGITVAADGLMLKPGGNPPSVKGCKIMQGTDTCFFSIVGIQSITTIHYDLVPMAVHACRGNGSIVERANAFEKSALPEVRRAWEHVKAHDPASYAVLTKSGEPVRVDVIFSGGPPFTVAIVQYTEDASGKMAIDKSTVDIGTFVNPPAYERVGASENVPVYQGQHREIEKLPDTDFLRGLLLGAIQLETQQPKRIGQPIAILEINASGARWVEQGACAEIKRSQTNTHK